jgi:hypothetical protein
MYSINDTVTSLCRGGDSYRLPHGRRVPVTIPCAAVQKRVRAAWGAIPSAQEVGGECSIDCQVKQRILNLYLQLVAGQLCCDSCLGKLA